MDRSNQPINSHQPIIAHAPFNRDGISRWPIIVWLLAVLSLSSGVLFLYPRMHLPGGVIASACRSLSAARRENAPLFASGLFASAERSLTSMFAESRNQNELFLLLRDYRRTVALALAADSLSRMALQSATTERDSLDFILAVCRDTLRARIMTVKKTFGGLPMTTDRRDQITRSELFFADAAGALERGDRINASILFDNARRFVTAASNELEKTMLVYFEQFPRWNTWVEQTVEWSRLHHGTAIIVDKMEHSLSLYQNGRLTMQVPVELGANWIGVKSRRGDHATPEGCYHIRWKRAPSLYHKALEIDYPNAEDRRRFFDADKNNSPPTPPDPGGGIEIHGGGGKKCNWTDGCIALLNDDIDNIYSRVCAGTPVTIVGTTSKSLVDSFRLIKMMNF